MIILPATTTVMMDGISESFDPGVERTEMERGVPKQRIVNTRVMAKIKASFYFETAAAADEFEDWYFDTLKRISWFQFRNPRNGRELTVRFEGGSIGELTLIDDTAFDSKRTVVLEYLR